MSNRRFRFFQWNDLHVRHEVAPEGGYPNANAKAAWSVSAACGETPIEAPDFVASVGDLVHGEPDCHTDDLAYLARLTQRLPVPLLPCLGNHENRQGEGMAESNVAWDEAVGAGWHNYLYTVGGFAFLVVDTSGGHRSPDEITRARSAFVERAFERVAGMPVFVLTHIPLVAMRREEALVPSFGFSSWKCVDESVWRIVAREATRVVAVLSGHIHITGSRVVDGVRHIMPSGTAGYPADMASFDVFDDRVEVQMHSAPADLIGDPSAGNIHGARRHGINYTDADHVDHERYLLGNPDERQFTIALDGARRPSPAAPLNLEIFHEAAPGSWIRVELP